MKNTSQYLGTSVSNGVFKELVEMTLLHSILLLTVASLTLADENIYLKLYEAQTRVQILHEKLAAECPGLLKDADFKYDRTRSLLNYESLKVRLVVENRLGDHLVELLQTCRVNKTVKKYDNNYAYGVSQCTSDKTVNLTEYWRNNYTGGSLSNSDKNKLDNGTTWFRFTGAAGSRLMNTCPLQDSCGSTGAYWSDDFMPKQVGETMKFLMYESYYDPGDSISECKTGGRKYSATVTRCSDKGDFVYKLEDSMSSESDTVCGTD